MVDNTNINSEEQDISSQELSNEDILRQCPNLKEDEQTCNDLSDEIRNYENKINYDIGYYWWKYYVYGAFWNNISTPINLAITIITALTTGQSASQNLISDTLNTKLGLSVLMLSIFNTFFRPHQQLTTNQLISKKWNKLGTKYDKLYYNKDYNNKDRYIKLKRLEKLFDEVNLLKRDNNNNYLIDLIFIIVNFTCIRKNIYWKPKKKNNKFNNNQIITTQPQVNLYSHESSDSNNSNRHEHHDNYELDDLQHISIS